MRLLARGIAFAALLCATAAQATPPRIVTADETVLADNGTHVFILRTVTDNLGYHTTAQSSVVLISRDLVTGADERQWPVLDILQAGSFGEDWSNFTNLDRAERINPFDVLLWRKASNLLPPPQPWRLRQTEVSADGIVYRDHEDRVTHRLDWDTANARITDSLHMTRSTLPAYQADHGDDLFIIPVRLGQDCTVSGLNLFFDYATPAPDRVLAHVTCPTDDRPLTTFVVIPPLR